MPPRKPTTQGPGVQFRDVELERWLAAQAHPGESLGRAAKRLLDEYRLVQVSPAVATTVRSLRRLAQRIEVGEIAP